MDKQAIICVGLGNGDEGKGTVVAALTEQYHPHTIVRFNGGAQAAHNVVTVDGRHHTFAQFGSGMFTPDVETYLSRYMLLAPTAMLNEAAHLSEVGAGDVLERTFIHQDAVVISPYHKLLNQMKERARGPHRHGSCGMGIGETMQDVVTHRDWVIQAKDLGDEQLLRKKLSLTCDHKYMLAKYSAEDDGLFLDYQEITGLDKKYIERWILGCLLLAENAHIVGKEYEKNLFDRDGMILFEGSQGVLLDEWHGFHPYTTWSTTTPLNAETMLADNGYDGKVTKMGILRPYATRHGAGPLPTEDEDLTKMLGESHNQNGEWQGKFRFGYFDEVMTRYAIDCCDGIDELALTHLDEVEQMTGLWKTCIAYEKHNKHESHTIRGFEVRYDKDLAYRESVTYRLQEYMPLYEYQNFYDADCVCDRIQNIFQIPITLHSWGPKTNEKVHCPVQKREESFAIR